MPMTRQQAQALAHFVNLCRPGWDEQGVMSQLGRLVNLNPLDVALATIRATADEAAKTPGVIATDGPHWKERAVDPARESNVRRPPKRHEECPTHAGQYRLACSGCTADRRAARDEVDAEQQAASARTRDEVLAQARADIRAAQEAAQSAPAARAVVRDARDEEGS